MMKMFLPSLFAAPALLIGICPGRADTLVVPYNPIFQKSHHIPAYNQSYAPYRNCTIICHLFRHALPTLTYFCPDGTGHQLQPPTPFK